MNQARNQWLRRWQPIIPGTQVNRLEYMHILRAAIDKFNRRTNVWIDQPTLLRILQLGVLNASQLSNLLEVSRPTFGRLVELHPELPDPAAPRGKIDRYDLDLMYLLVQQLTLGKMPKDFLLEALPYCGDVTIVSFLTGVPVSTIYRYRRRRELEDGIDYRQRIANDPQLLESLGQQV